MVSLLVRTIIVGCETDEADDCRTFVVAKTLREAKAACDSTTKGDATPAIQASGIAMAHWQRSKQE